MEGRSLDSSTYPTRYSAQCDSNHASQPGDDHCTVIVHAGTGNSEAPLNTTRDPSQRVGAQGGNVGQSDMQARVATASVEEGSVTTPNEQQTRRSTRDVSAMESAVDVRSIAGANHCRILEARPRSGHTGQRTSPDNEMQPMQRNPAANPSRLSSPEPSVVSILNSREVSIQEALWVRTGKDLCNAILSSSESPQCTSRSTMVPVETVCLSRQMGRHVHFLALISATMRTDRKT